MSGTTPHDGYGPCDGFGPSGSCSECVRLARRAALLEAAERADASSARMSPLLTWDDVSQWLRALAEEEPRDAGK